MAGGDDVRCGEHSRLPTASEKVERAVSSVSRGMTFIFCNNSFSITRWVF